MELIKEKTYTTPELMAVLLAERPGYKPSSLYNRIAELEKSGAITRVGKSRYACGRLDVFAYDLQSTLAKRVLRHMKRAFAPDLEYALYETSAVLNPFLNHLLAHPTVILEVPRDFMEPVFYSLKAAGFRNVLLDPDAKEVARYADEDAVIVHRLVSKAPIDAKRKKTTIEKLMVDIVCDDLLRCFFEGAEVPRMLETILEDYKVRIDRACNYARRRHALDTLQQFLPKEAK